MKKLLTLFLTAGMLLGAASGASAIDFQAKGQWIVGFGLANADYEGNRSDTADNFGAQQRVRLQLDAVASETLSGTVFFEIGDTQWGQGSSGGALGADGKVIELKRAYIDWVVPSTQLKVRMGIQDFTLPNVAGGSAILSDDAAGIVASYTFNDMVSLTALWARPFNDNLNSDSPAYSLLDDVPTNYLDNVDLFALALPVTGENWSITPWVMYGIMGAYTPYSFVESNGGLGLIGNSGYSALGLFPNTGYNPLSLHLTGDAYTSMVFLGLPMTYTVDAWNFELDLNYASVAQSATYGATNQSTGDTVRADNQRSGWLIKGLMEYKLDWGTPGLFAWYGSGDDDDVKNGSEMMPYLSPCGNFTSMLGDGELGYSLSGTDLGYDQMLNYSGTWGIGLQIKDLSFMEDLSHIVRVAYWGGTNSTEMAKYMSSTGATDNVGWSTFYLTEGDYLVEVNVDSTYQIYENLQAVLQLGYVFNGIDSDTWKKAGSSSVETEDGYRVGLMFNYSF